MIDQDELMKMAREADLIFNEHLGNEETKKHQQDRVLAFACAILERAAVECEGSFFGDAGELNHEIAEAVRALKPTP
jgi:hypothetical protein